MAPFSEKTKRAAVKRVESGKPVKAVAEKVGCSPSALRTWVRQLGTPAAPSPEPAVEVPPEKPAAADIEFDLYDRQARVVSVFGPFASRVLIEIPTSEAEPLFPHPLVASSRSEVFEGVERDLAEIAELDEDLAKSGLAGTARALALEIENPYNSATSKAMCAGQLRDTLARLRELAPEEKEEDALDEIAKRRAARLADGASAS